METVHLYCSFAPPDCDQQQRLEAYLAPMVRQGRLRLWHREKLLAGDEIQRVVERQLSQAQLVLLLLSADYLADDNCYLEMEKIFALSQDRDLCIIPIVLRRCEHNQRWISSLASLPKRPVSEYADKEQAWSEIATALLRKIDAIGRTAQASTQHTPPDAACPVATPSQSAFSPASPPPRIGIAIPHTFRRLGEKLLRGQFLVTGWKRFLILAMLIAILSILVHSNLTQHYPALLTVPTVEESNSVAIQNLVKEMRLIAISCAARSADTSAYTHVCLRADLKQGMIHEVEIRDPSDDKLRSCIVDKLVGRTMTRKHDLELRANFQLR